MILGSAAGGGLPQWNCACHGCEAARRGDIPARTQSSLAISANGEAWFLINASPDLRGQLMNFAPLQPAAGNARGIPLGGILLTNGDLDHTLGVLLLRESDKPLTVHAPADVQRSLPWMDHLLGGFSGIAWQEPSSEMKPLSASEDGSTVLRYRCLNVSGEGDTKLSVAYAIEDEITGRRLLVAPDVGRVSDELRHELALADAVFWDGTFWQEDELARVAPGKRGARAMGHLPLAEEGLTELKSSPAPLKVLIHINNTNPMLLPGSPQRQEVEDAGIIVAEDGLSFEL